MTLNARFICCGAVGRKSGGMAKPKPPIEERKMRTSVSLPLAMVIAFDMLRHEHPELHLRDFSDGVKRGLYDFLEKRAPGIIVRATEHIRINYSPAAIPAAPMELRVAEEPAAYAAEQREIAGLAAGAAKAKAAKPPVPGRGPKAPARERAGPR